MRKLSTLSLLPAVLSLLVLSPSQSQAQSENEATMECKIEGAVRCPCVASMQVLCDGYDQAHFIMNDVMPLQVKFEIVRVIMNKDGEIDHVEDHGEYAILEAPEESVRSYYGIRNDDPELLNALEAAKKTLKGRDSVKVRVIVPADTPLYRDADGTARAEKPPLCLRSIQADKWYDAGELDVRVRFSESALYKLRSEGFFITVDPKRPDTFLVKHPSKRGFGLFPDFENARYEAKIDLRADPTGKALIHLSGVNVDKTTGKQLDAAPQVADYDIF